MAISKLTPAKTRGGNGPTCGVCAALARISPKEAAALRAHLANPEWRYTELSAALAADKDTPLDLPDFVLSNHARGRCSAREKLRGA